jgi:hypothetical protein
MRVDGKASLRRKTVKKKTRWRIEHPGNLKGP